MLELGQLNTLSISRKSDYGLYLVDDSANEVLLPNKYVPENIDLAEPLEVFLYKDSDERIVATTLTPKVMLNGFGVLLAKNKTGFGAFFDWGLEKDLMVPIGEQAEPVIEGEYYVVYLYLDEKTQRLAGSTKIHSKLEKEHVELEIGQQVELIPYEDNEIGISVIVDGKYKGMLFKNEVFQSIQVGEKLTGYVKKIRDDKKVDVSLNKFGYRAVDANVEKVLNALNENNGFLNLTDKSSPEDISDQLGMSKKLFKKAIGALYKQKKISIEESGIKVLD